MGFVQDIVARKLSALLGMHVELGGLSVSLLRGSIEARDVRIQPATDTGQLDTASSEPLLTIGRLRLDLAIARALKGEIVVKSLRIERPTIRLLRRADGSFDLPSLRKPAFIRPAGGGDARPASPLEGRWTLDVEKVSIVDATVNLSVAGKLAGSDDPPAMRMEAQNVFVELARRPLDQGAGFDATVSIDRIGLTIAGETHLLSPSPGTQGEGPAVDEEKGARSEPAAGTARTSDVLTSAPSTSDSSTGARSIASATNTISRSLGSLRAQADLSGVREIAQLAGAEVVCNFELAGDAGRLQGRVQSIGPARDANFTADVAGDADAAKLAEVLPAALVARFMLPKSGKLAMALRGSFSQAAGAKVDDLSVRVTDATL